MILRPARTVSFFLLAVLFASCARSQKDCVKCSISLDKSSVDQGGRVELTITLHSERNCAVYLHDAMVDTVRIVSLTAKGTSEPMIVGNRLSKVQRIVLESQHEIVIGGVFDGDFVDFGAIGRLDVGNLESVDLAAVVFPESSGSSSDEPFVSGAVELQLVRDR